MSSDQHKEQQFTNEVIHHPPVDANNAYRKIDTEPKYPKWLLQLSQDMLDMRDSQREYFNQPTDYKLRLAKVKEQKADAWLQRMIDAKLITHKPKPTDNQSSLFKS